MRERDQQRSRVYTSDKALIAISKPLATVPEIERYVRRVFGMKRVQDAYPEATSPRFWGRLPSVGDGRGRRRACGSSSGIKIPKWARNEAVVLHELAHTICLRMYDRRIAAHGWQYCSIYLALTLHAMGREAHDVLKKAFRENRVRFTEPRKRKPMDPVRKAELVARLAAYRAAKQKTAPDVNPGPM